jgi:hypothetical protein
LLLDFWKIGSLDFKLYPFRFSSIGYCTLNLIEKGLKMIPQTIKSPSQKSNFFFPIEAVEPKDEVDSLATIGVAGNKNTAKERGEQHRNKWTWRPCSGNSSLMPFLAQCLRN